MQENPFDDLPAAQLAPAEKNSRLPIRNFLHEYPDYAVILVALFANFVTLAFVTGYGLEPSRLFGIPELKATPFGHAYASVDSIILGVVTSQLSLVMFWCVASKKRLLLCRIAAFVCTLLVFAIVLQYMVNRRYWLNQVLAVFVSISLGSLVASLILWFRGWRISTKQCTYNQSSKYSMSELLVLSTLVALGLALTSVLRYASSHEYLYFQQFLSDVIVLSRLVLDFMVGFALIATIPLSTAKQAPAETKRNTIVFVILMFALAFAFLGQRAVHYSRTFWLNGTGLRTEAIRHRYMDCLPYGRRISTGTRSSKNGHHAGAKSANKARILRLVWRSYYSASTHNATQ